MKKVFLWACVGAVLLAALVTRAQSPVLEYRKNNALLYKAAGFYDVDSYGAVGAGTLASSATNALKYALYQRAVEKDHNAFQQAIWDANANGGGTVLLGPKEYHCGWWTYATNYTSENHLNVIDLTGVTNVTIQGAGINLTTIKLAANTNELFMNWFGGGDTVGMTTSGPTNLAIRHLTLNGNFAPGGQTNQNYAYDTTQFYNCDNILFEFVRFKNLAEDAVDSYGNVIVRNCIFENVGDTCFGSGPHHYAADNYVTNAGWAFGTNSAIVEVNVGEEAVIERCVFYGGSERFLMNGRSTWRDCVFVSTNGTDRPNFYNNASGVTELTMENCRVYAVSNRNNWFIGTTNAGANITLRGSEFYTGVKALNVTNASDVLLTGNKFHSSGSVPDVMINGAQRVRAIGNSFVMNGNYAFRFGTAARSDRAIIQGNTFYEANLGMSSSTSNAVISGNWFQTGYLVLDGSDGGGGHIASLNVFNTGGGMFVNSGFNSISGNRGIPVLQFDDFYARSNKFVGNTINAAPSGARDWQSTNSFWSGNTWSNSGVAYSY